MFFWTLLKILIISYFLLCIFIYSYQERLIYFPNRSKGDDPSSLGLKFEQIFLKTSDGVRISAWLVPCDQPRAALIFCHGNAANLHSCLPNISLFHKLGLTVLAFDYRGYGLSEGSISESGTGFDAEAAWDFLGSERGFKPDQIIIAGQSLGGAVAARLAALRNPGMLILESTFTSIQEMARQQYPFLPVKMLCRVSYNTIESLEKIHCPVLIIHSPMDEMIPFTMGQALFAKASGPKAFLPISGDHNSGFQISGDIYTQGLSNFMDKFLNGACSESR